MKKYKTFICVLMVLIIQLMFVSWSEASQKEDRLKEKIKQERIKRNPRNRGRSEWNMKNRFSKNTSNKKDRERPSYADFDKEGLKNVFIAFLSIIGLVTVLF
jgi:hypothetical protein